MPQTANEKRKYGSNFVNDDRRTSQKGITLRMPSFSPACILMGGSTARRKDVPGDLREQEPAAILSSLNGLNA
jgi:hypothetical protein